MLKALTLGVAILAALAQVATACAFHGYTPKPTLIDKLYASEQIILARPDPADPSRYAPVAALAGDTAYVELPQTPDATTRARLLAAPDTAVLFARDGAYGPWVNLAILDTRYRAVVEAALKQQFKWQGNTGPARYQFFAKLLNDPNADIRQLALLELDRADYRILRKLRLRGLSGLGVDLDAGDAKLRPIRILLAGLSRDKSLIAPLSSGMQRGAARNLPYLGAYATALVELGGADAADQILTRMLTNPDYGLDSRERIIEALAIHGLYGSGAVRRTIKRGVPILLQSHPDLAGPVARQFGRHGNWDMGRAVAATKAAHPNVTLRDSFAINQYIAVAGDGG